MNEQSETIAWSEVAMYVVGGLAGAMLGILGAMWVAGAMAAQSPIFWFISRAAAIVSFLLLWLSTAWGISVSTKGLGGRVSGAVAHAMHNVTSWLALGFAALHGLSLLADTSLKFDLAGILIPFVSSYKPVLTGLGIMGLYAGIAATAAFYFRKRLGYKAWRTLHGVSYAMFFGVALHGILIGSDSSSAVMQAIYVVATVSVVLLTIFRIITAQTARARAAVKRAAPAA